MKKYIEIINELIDCDFDYDKLYDPQTQMINHELLEEYRHNLLKQMNYNYPRIDKKYKFREILIALCMPLYDCRYLNPFNLDGRLWTIHNFTDYYNVKAPIINAAKHCVWHWSTFIIDLQLPDTFEGASHAAHYYKM